MPDNTTSIDDLKELTDEELLKYINRSTGVEAKFKSIFETHIITDNHRLSFWLQNRVKINQTVYVKAIVEGLTTKIQTQGFNKIEDLIEFCDWILSLSDNSTQRGEKEQSILSSNQPGLEHCRKAVVEFILNCVNTNAPISARDSIAGLLDKVCNQSETGFVNNGLGNSNIQSQFIKGLNNSRSYGLKVLIINFGGWVQRQLPSDTVPEVTRILSKRIIKPAKIPLTEPEYAILGQSFGLLNKLNPNWTSKHSKLFFPRENTSYWKCSFGTYLCYNPPIEFLIDEYNYALENLEFFSKNHDPNEDHDPNEIITHLGMGVYILFLRKFYDLESENSLLNKFYKKTNDHPEFWKFLFDEVGQSLMFGELKEYKDRAVDFLNWRLEVGTLQELHNFYGWLESECLEPSLRLNSYLKILNLPRDKHLDNLIDIRTLITLHQKEELLVVKCLAKLSELFPRNHFVSKNELNNLDSILEASLKSNNSEIVKLASFVKEKLIES